MSEFDYDVVVVGAGAAGLAAAVEAADAGATVMLVDSEDVVGGSSRLSCGILMGAGTHYQRAVGIEDSADNLYEHYLTVNQWNVEQSLVRVVADGAGPAIEWLGDLGVTFLDDIYFSGDEAKPRGHMPRGEGAEIIDVLHRAARSRGVDIALRRRIDRLLVEQGRVVGIAAGDDAIRARSVVLTTGGFGANPGLREQYLPAAVRHTGDWMWYNGPESSRGDIFELVAPVDAQICGHNRAQFNLRPDFAHEVEAYLPGWLVVVNANGNRFFDETSPYSVTDPIIRAQPGPVWAVLDDSTKRAAQPRVSRAAKKVDVPGLTWEDWVEPVIDEMVAKDKVVKADSLEELASAIGVPDDALAGTIAQYNADVAAGADTRFGKKSEVMRPVIDPPFYATELRLIQLAVTAVGPRIDAQARVMDRRSGPVPGLFAAGECVGGVLGPVYLGSGNSYTNCLTFGRVAGRSAAKMIS